MYVPMDSLTSGVGYWLKFPTGDTVLLCGNQVLLDTIGVAPGWNMVGTISTSIPASSIGSEPPGIKTSPFFGYGGSYAVADTLYPGRGYCVKVSEVGDLILSSVEGYQHPGRISIIPTSEEPPPPPLEQMASPPLPEDYALGEAYPNPFNPATVVHFDIPNRSAVSLKIFDLLGREVATLVDEVKSPGRYEARWQATIQASGVYLCRIQAGSFTATRKLLLVK